MKKWLLCLLPLSLFLSLSACNTPVESESETESQSESEPEKEREPVDIYEAFAQKTLEYGEGCILPYRIYVPDDYSEEKNYPVLLFLHGGGERGNDNTLQLKNVIPLLFEDADSPVYDAIVVCPQSPAGMQWVDTPSKNGSYDFSETPVSIPMQGVMELLALVERE